MRSKRCSKPASIAETAGWHRHSCLCPRPMPSVQSTPRCIGVPPLRSQNRPRIGRGDRDVGIRLPETPWRCRACRHRPGRIRKWWRRWVVGQFEPVAAGLSRHGEVNSPLRGGGAIWRGELAATQPPGRGKFAA
jgi:hypothetical protein